MNLSKKVRFFRHAVLAMAGVSLVTTLSSAGARFSFLGVSAGDPGATGAVLWTRGVDNDDKAAANLTLQISTDSTFAVGVTQLPAATIADADYTAKVIVQNLTPGTRYYYRFVGPGGVTSNTGMFKTAPDATTSAAVRFAFSGDVDGLMRPYAATKNFNQLDLDFFVFIRNTFCETASGTAGQQPPRYSPAVASSGTIPAPNSIGATSTQLFDDHTRKYREQFLPVNTGGQPGLLTFYASQGNYTLLDNHELGNKQYINRDAPSRGAVGEFAAGAGVDARVNMNDANMTGDYIHSAGNFRVLQEVFFDYHPLLNRGTLTKPGDSSAHGTQQYYFAQQWGRNAIYIDTDDRSYRDLRTKTAGNADDTSGRADNLSRTMLGATQLAWLEKTLLDAQKAGTPWKFVAISRPIDQIGPIDGALTGIFNAGGPGYTPPNADDSKSWMGGYRAERNQLLKFIADHQITNVVFLTTDDHQNRVDKLFYSPTGDMGNQSSYVKVPYCFQVLAGPLGATGPDGITNHAFSNLKAMADSFDVAQNAAHIEPFGLKGYPGLHNVIREGDPNADANRSAFDFYSPDTFNYSTLEVSADGKTLTVSSWGILATAQNAFSEYDAANNPLRKIFSFQIDAASPINSIDHIVVVYEENWSFDGLYGSFPGANGIAGASTASLTQRSRLTGSPLSSESSFNRVQGSGTVDSGNTNTNPGTLNNPPQPLNGAVDSRFNTVANDPNSPLKVNTLLPFGLESIIPPRDKTGDLVHRYWQEQFQINRGTNDRFITWSDNPGLVMSHFDATNLPEGLLAQQYVMSDNFFHSAFGGSFLNHQFLIAAAAPTYPNAASLNASAIATLDSSGILALNENGKLVHDGSITPIGGQAYAGTPGQTFDQNYVVNTSFSINMATSTTAFPGGVPPASLLPSQNDSNPADTTRPFRKTIGDLLDDAGISWKWYSGGYENALQSSPSNPLHYGNSGPNNVDSLFQSHHQPFVYYDRYKPFDASQADGRSPFSAARLQDETKFFADVINNTLPAVSFIKPLGPNDEHPGYASLQQGQDHVASIVQALQNNPTLWARTAIIITYDEHGGRWDHVTPLARDIWGPGVRVPAIVISPLAKRGYVDHELRDTSSILATIERRFGLPSLNERDASALSFADVFTNLEITRGAYNRDRKTGKISQTVTLTNRGNVPITGPVDLVLDNLSSNAALSNANGTTTNNLPAGSPFIIARTGDLASRASVSTTLQFAAPATGSITYSARTVSGTATP